MKQLYAAWCMVCGFAIGGCSLTTAPSIPAINASLIRIEQGQDGRVLVSGMPGTATGGAGQVDVAVHRTASQSDAQLPVDADGHARLMSETVRVAADGSFPTVTLGSNQVALLTGDELNLRPARVYWGRPTQPSVLPGKTATFNLK